MTVNNLAQFSRVAYRLLFGFYAPGFGAWFLSNLATGNLIEDWGYVLRVAMVLLLLGEAIYLLAFRLKDDVFLNLNLLILSASLIAGIAEAGVRIWDHYNPVFQPVELADERHMVDHCCEVETCEEKLALTFRIQKG